MKKLFFALLVIGFSFTSCKSLQNAKALEADLTGTKWNMTYELKQYGKRSFEIEFRKGGQLFNKHPNTKNGDDDTWEQTGSKVILKFNGGFAIYRGTRIDKRTIVGKAKSANAGEWDWKATKLK